MKKYKEPEMKPVVFAAEDVIQTSGPTPGNELTAANIMGKVVDYTLQGWDN